MSQLLQNALYGSAMILAAALLRRALGDRLAPEARLALWAACLFRLLTPAAPASVLSLWGLPRLFAPERPAAAPGYVLSIPAGVSVPAPTLAPAPAAQTGLPWQALLAAVWLTVAAVLAARYAASWRRTRRAVACTSLLDQDDPRYAPLPRCARLREGPMEGAPLTFGVLRPTVVLLPGLEGAELDCVLAHEGVHARRRDNLWHYVMALALVVHWWDPAVWLMARLLRRDIELSCDRAALRRLGEDRRADYANALVSLATQTDGPAFCHTFGRKAAEERILSIMKCKKTSVLGVALSLVLVFGVTAAFASDPKEPDARSKTGLPAYMDNVNKLDSESAAGGIFYKDGSGRLIPVDPATVDTAVTVTVDNEGNITIDDGSGPVTVEMPEGPYVWTEGKDGAVLPFFGGDYTLVDPETVDLSKIKEYLAKKVADGELTQAEADEMLANVQTMVEQAKEGGATLWISMYNDGNADSFCVSSYGAVGSSSDDVELDPSGAGTAPRTSSGAHALCSAADCTVTGAHYHDNGQVVPVSYQDPYTAPISYNHSESHHIDDSTGLELCGYPLANSEVFNTHHNESHH